MNRTKFSIVFMTIVCFLFLFGVDVPPAHAQDVDLSYFYQELSPYGTWVQYDPYGWIWYPNNVPPDWRPYTDGHWVDTDDYGWMWVSDWDWGWATFHYGRWLWTDDYGWAWIPGYVWGPAWVAWRSGDGYTGWAPLPPWVGWDWSSGLTLGDYDLGDIPWSQWVFCNDDDFLSARLYDHIVLAPRNVTLIRRTRNVTRFAVVDGRVVNHGISTRRLEEVIGAPITPMHVRRVEKLGDLRLPGLGRDEIRTYQPRISTGPVNISPLQFGTMERRHEAERAVLHERHNAESEFLQREHRSEQRAPQVSEDELRRQQQQEGSALKEQHYREERALQNRQQHEIRFGPSSIGQEAQPGESGQGAPSSGELRQESGPSGQVEGGSSRGESEEGGAVRGGSEGGRRER